ncbi:uncharacterized protein LOC105837111 [Monomorium pharaonis]|uniref:uncharacterized protein LOC105837111 n=1 Tax=Monomorium pharaonis TaxID=307658 RepID=UPI00063EF0D9|nr:uncharacterized protein LOC105837111 [Monomorium pharaonis]
MSTHITMTGNHVNPIVRRGRMVLSDLDQIKKNERDRRRRLRLEQVRQQSKEISNRLLERAKKIAREELSKLEKDGKSELRQMHNRKIMDIQRKYQEDLEDIGQAHASAALQPDTDAIIEEEAKKNRIVALKRGKDAAERMRETKQTDDAEAAYQERLRRVREAENVRATMIARLLKQSSEENDGIEGNPTQSANRESATYDEAPTPKRKDKKALPKKSPIRTRKSNLQKALSPKPGPSGLQQQKSAVQSQPELSSKKQADKFISDRIERVEEASDDQVPRRTVPTMSIIPTKQPNKTTAKYNSEDYMQNTSENTTSSDVNSSSSSSSDDSSYFSDAVEQITSYSKIPRPPPVLTENKVRSQYDHNIRQRPSAMVERVDIINEPSAMEVAHAMRNAENADTHISKNHKLSAAQCQRGKDAILRERVRRDYQALLQNLEHLAQEERKLKASQIQSVKEDPYTLLHQRNKYHKEHQRRLNRATKNVLCTDSAPTRCSHLVERVITLPTQKKESDVPHSTWQNPYLVEEQADVCYTPLDKDSEMLSREEQILDMLKKVERQKRLLLQEFGASLPDNIFNVSMRSVCEGRTPRTKATEKVYTTKPLSPEIKVINMSNSDECISKSCKAKNSDKLPTKKIEIAVQTAPEKIRSSAENKGIQVKLPQERDVHPAHPSKEAATRVPHPIEPIVTIITPEADKSSISNNRNNRNNSNNDNSGNNASSDSNGNSSNVSNDSNASNGNGSNVSNDSNASNGNNGSNGSNNSSCSEISGMIIEVGKKEVIVTPKKRKSSVRASKRPSPRIYQKIRSTPVSSKGTSPMKKCSKTQPGIRQTPQKKRRCLDTPDTATRRVNIHISRSDQVGDETDPSQETRVSIDASAESSQTLSGVNGDYAILGTPYWIRTRTKKWIRVRDTSDTSTSYASPPPIRPRSALDALANVTPILELLDSPAPEELRRQQRDVSPVSTPETPSPRTMMMPSNIPHRDRVSRMLRFNMNDSQTNDSVVISTQDQSTLTEPSDVCQRSETSRLISATSQQPESKLCICKNPECKLLHMKLDDIQDYALKNCPEILKKYEELQNLCSERIASLTDLIEKVRNEQKDMDFSLISPNDETSLMQLPTPKRTGNDTEAIRRLIDSIETIHAQLARTLLESQRIMQGSETVSKDETSCDAEIQAITSTPRSKLVDTVKAQKSKVVEGKAKPKIISNEKVNIQLNRFKMQQKPQATTSTTKTTERNSWPPCTLPLYEEEIIEKLSKEILEQSKNLDKASIALAALKENDETQHKMSSFKNLNMKQSALLEQEKDNNVARKLISTAETMKENSFIPILTDIPKILRNHGIVSSMNRPKPPVTLLNGLYRPELESSGHELSTIVEFDTTDTANKTSKSPVKSKPSVHVAPLPVQQNQHFSKISADSSSGMKHSIEKLPFVQKSQETTAICNSPEKLKSVTDCITETKIEAEQEDIFEKSNKQLQCNTTTDEPVSQVKDKLGSSISTDLNNPHKESKHKTTSTSVYSFSGLSGISEMTSSPSSNMLKHNSSPEEMETALKKLGLGWAVTTLKKTREASALSSSSNSDVTPINTARKMISPTKKHHDSNGFPDISDVSSISIKEASKSTEQAVLLKGRTSTPKFQNSNSNSERSSTTNTSESVQDPSDSLTVPNVSLTKSDNKQLQSP